MAKMPPYMGMGTLCTNGDATIYGYGDTLQWQKCPGKKKCIFMPRGKL